MKDNHITINKRQHLAKHIDKRLRFRFRLYFLISIVMLGFVFYDIATAKIIIEFALLGIIAGIIVGVISSRMFHITWSHDANKVVSQLDKFGIIILILYILFELERSNIVGIFIQGPQIGSVSFSVLTGVMIGRVIGTRGKILQVLKEQKIFF